MLCTVVFRELRKRGERRIAFSTRNPSLFANNPDIDVLIDNTSTRAGRWKQEGLVFEYLTYSRYDAATDRDSAPAENFLVTLCRVAGISGEVKLRPYMHVTPRERMDGLLASDQITIQSSGMSVVFLPCA